MPQAINENVPEVNTGKIVNAGTSSDTLAPGNQPYFLFNNWLETQEVITKMNAEVTSEPVLKKNGLSMEEIDTITQGVKKAVAKVAQKALVEFF